MVLVEKNLPANAGDFRDTGSIPRWEDPLEKEMATHSSILAWENPDGQRCLAGYTPWVAKSNDWVTNHSTTQYHH